MLYEGDTPLEVFIVTQGVIKVYDIDEQGKEKILHLLKAPALIPFAFFSGMREPLKWFYVTLTDCDVYSVSAKEVRDMMRKDWQLAEALTDTETGVELFTSSGPTWTDDIEDMPYQLTVGGEVVTVIAAILAFLAFCWLVWEAIGPVPH